MSVTLRQTAQELDTLTACQSDWGFHVTCVPVSVDTLGTTLSPSAQIRTISVGYASIEQSRWIAKKHWSRSSHRYVAKPTRTIWRNPLEGRRVPVVYLHSSVAAFSDLLWPNSNFTPNIPLRVVSHSSSPTIYSGGTVSTGVFSCPK